MTAAVGAEMGRGSQVDTMVATEVAGIPGSTLVLLPTGNYALISDAINPPDPDEVLALLVEFLPPDWVCYDETAEEDRDVAYYGPDWTPNVSDLPPPRVSP